MVLRDRNGNAPAGSTPRTALAVALVASLVLAPCSAAVADDDEVESAPSGRIQGEVADAAGGRVLAYHVDTGTMHASEPLKKDGKFRIENLPRGIYDIAVETETGSLYVASEVLHLPPSGKVSVDFRLEPYPPEGPPAGRERFAGSDAPGVGLARVEPKLAGKDFWRSPKGLAIVGGVGASVLLWLAVSGDDDERLASPFN